MVTVRVLRRHFCNKHQRRVSKDEVFTLSRQEAEKRLSIAHPLVELVQDNEYETQQVAPTETQQITESYLAVKNEDEDEDDDTTPPNKQTLNLGDEEDNNDEAD